MLEWNSPKKGKNKCLSLVRGWMQLVLPIKYLRIDQPRTNWFIQNTRLRWVTSNNLLNMGTQLLLLRNPAPFSRCFPPSNIGKFLDMTLELDKFCDLWIKSFPFHSKDLHFFPWPWHYAQTVANSMNFWLVSWEVQNVLEP